LLESIEESIEEPIEEAVAKITPYARAY